MLKKGDITIYFPKLITYLTILLIVVIDSFILASTKKYFNYFEDFKTINPDTTISVSSINDKEAAKVFTTVESLIKYDSKETVKLPSKETHNDIFKIKYSQAELMKFISLSNAEKK